VTDESAEGPPGTGSGSPPGTGSGSPPGTGSGSPPVARASYLLAFDFGLKYIGVAVGQTITGTANPLETLNARDGKPDWDNLAALVGHWQPGLLLVGLPLNMDDTESDMSQRARRFAAALSKRTGIEHEMVDERLSSFAANEITSGENHGPAAHSIATHSIAAALIAETWLNQRR